MCEYMTCVRNKLKYEKNVFAANVFSEGVQCEREILSLLVSRPPIEKSNFLSHAYNGRMPIGRDYPRVHLRRAVSLRSITSVGYKK